MTEEMIPEGAYGALLTEVNERTCLVRLASPPRPSLQYLTLEIKNVFTEEQPAETPLKGYVVYSSTDTKGWYSFFEEGWEHGELL